MGSPEPASDISSASAKQSVQQALNAGPSHLDDDSLVGMLIALRVIPLSPWHRLAPMGALVPKSC